MLKLRTLLIAGCAVALLGCENPAQKAEANATRAEAELSPRERVALYEAKFAVLDGLMSGSMLALRQLGDANEEAEMPAELDRPDAEKLTVFFAANNHGEREDCGCRRNPLGGLGRRHTLLNLLRDGSPEEVAKWWGEAQPAAGPVFHVDAGDGFYRNATISRGNPQAQAIAKHDARSVIEALNVFPPDAYLVGELDAAFGAEDLAANAKRAEFPLISANLAAADGAQLFPGHVVVERDGRKIGVIGVTNKDTRIGTYWADNGFKVSDPLAAARAELAKLPPDLDLVVLLSNLGLNDTQKLVKGLEQEKRGVNLAVVSGSNRLISDPVFVSGVPIVEPLTQGKYVGRADFVLNGDDVQFRNASAVTRSQRADYRRALRNYHTTRKQLLRDKQKLAELELTAQKPAPKAQEPAANAEREKRMKEGIAAQKKRIETSEARLATVSEGLLATLRPLEAPQKATGDDWVDADVVPVKIEIPEPKETRRVLDRAKKSRPEAKQAASPAPKKKAQGVLKRKLPKGLPTPNMGTAERFKAGAAK